MKKIMQPLLCGLFLICLLGEVHLAKAQEQRPGASYWRDITFSQSLSRAEDRIAPDS